MWLNRVLLSCVLLLLFLPFSWNSCLVWYQISYDIWYVGILVVGFICYPLMLRTQIVHFSFPVVWHPTIMCHHFLCLYQCLPWLYVVCAVCTCAFFSRIAGRLGYDPVSFLEYFLCPLCKCWFSAIWLSTAYSASCTRKDSLTSLTWFQVEIPYLHSMQN